MCEENLIFRGIQLSIPFCEHLYKNKLTKTLGLLSKFESPFYNPDISEFIANGNSI